MLSRTSVRTHLASLALTTLVVSALHAQQPLRRTIPVALTDAVEAATTRGPSVSLAAFDTAAGRARLAMARSIGNPILSLSYTENTPRQHVDLALPLDFVWLRGLRVKAAERDADVLRLQFAFQVAAARYQVVGAYARAAASNARARLSERTAADADSLLQMAVLRESTGDVSRLEVELARINRGDAHIRASQDSLNASTGVLEVQRLMAMAPDRVEISLTDSLPAIAAAVAPSVLGDSMTGRPLLVAAAARNVEARTLALTAEHRRAYGAPAVSVGFEAGNPGTTGLLPTVGISLPLPLLTRNRGEIALATTERARAVAALEIAKRDAATALATAERTRDLAALRVTQTRELLASAERIASLTLVAYREGEVPLSFVLEATRRARDLRDGYITALSELASSHAGVALHSILVTIP
ncbi:MAG: TolC family protein [bacterium]